MRDYALFNELKTASGEAGSARKMLIALFALSFFWISYISQTHIHGTPQGDVQTFISKVFQGGDGVAPAAPIKGNPGDQSDCPLCQAVALGGIFLLPLLVILINLLRVSEGSPVFVASRPATGFRRLHHQTRGPPSA